MDLARALELTVVAEGIEEPESLAQLTKWDATAARDTSLPTHAHSTNSSHDSRPYAETAGQTVPGRLRLVGGQT